MFGVDRDVGEDLRGRPLADREVHAAAPVGLDHPSVGQLVEADRLAEVRRPADLDLLVVLQHGRAAVAVDRVGLAGGPAERAVEVRGQARVEARGRVAEAGVERAAALVVLAPGERVVGTHRAAGDAVERVALWLRAERILDDRGQHVRYAADVRRCSCRRRRCGSSTRAGPSSRRGRGR